MPAIRDIDVTKTWVLSGTLNFTRFFFKERYKRKFVVGKHHVRIAKALDDVLRGKTTRLIINIAPRYGKTEIAVKNFIAEGLAINPAARFIHLSYSDDLARDNSRGVQEILRCSSYRRLFPGTMPTGTSTRKWFTAAGGGLYAVSSAGQVTGFGAGVVDKDEDDELMQEIDELQAAALSGSADGRLTTTADPDKFGGAIIIDDPIKPDDARSEQIRDKVNQKFETTIRNRVNSRRTPIIIIMQRLDEDDLCGYLQKLEPDEWTVLRLPCIETSPDTGEDEALWPFKHTLEELRKLEEKNGYVFDTQYMQNPKPVEGLMYERLKTYDALPVGGHIIKNYTDTADTGADFHCSIDYAEYFPTGEMYVLDVLFTDKGMEYTEPEQARMMTADRVVVANIEGNNGGRGFARAVERNMRELGNTKTRVMTFNQRGNKIERIFVHSVEVQNLIYFPTDWRTRWPLFYNAVTSFMKKGRNAHDDAPDALTGMVEMRTPQQRTRISRT